MREQKIMKQKGVGTFWRLQMQPDQLMVLVAQLQRTERFIIANVGLRDFDPSIAMRRQCQMDGARIAVIRLHEANPREPARIFAAQVREHGRGTERRVLSLDGHGDSLDVSPLRDSLTQILGVSNTGSGLSHGGILRQGN